MHLDIKNRSYIVLLEGAKFTATNNMNRAFRFQWQKSKHLVKQILRALILLQVENISVYIAFVHIP